MAQFKNDYRLNAEESARITCNSCERKATTGQNNGSAPFWYHCDTHAAMGRTLGSSFIKEHSC
jgi:hypothetical protein